MDRFDDRTTRLARRQESDVFANYIMPISWFLGLLALLCLIALSWSKHPADASQGSAMPLLAAIAASPFVMLVVRICRGHFHKDIREKRTKI